MSLLDRLKGRGSRTTSAAGVAESQATDEVLAELRAMLVEQSGGALSPAAIDPAAPLLQFGYVDSLSAVNFVEQIRVRYGLDVSEDDLVGELSTLGAVASFVAARRRRPK